MHYHSNVKIFFSPFIHFLCSFFRSFKIFNVQLTQFLFLLFSSCVSSRALCVQCSKNKPFQSILTPTLCNLIYRGDKTKHATWSHLCEAS